MHAWRGWHWWPGKTRSRWPSARFRTETAGRTSSWPCAAARCRCAPRRRDAGNWPRSGWRRSSGRAASTARRRGSWRRHGALRAARRDSGLLALPAPELRPNCWDLGIGPETADASCLLREAARVRHRTLHHSYLPALGGGPEGEAYDAWQRWFEAALPADANAWARYHALIVLHAKYLCRKLRPRCGECTLRPRCPGSAALEAMRADA